MPAAVSIDLAQHALARFDAVMKQTLELCEDEHDAAAVAYLVSIGIVSRCSHLLDAAVPGFEQLDSVGRTTVMLACIGRGLTEGLPPTGVKSHELAVVMSNVRKLLARELLNVSL